MVACKQCGDKANFVGDDFREKLRVGEKIRFIVL